MRREPDYFLREEDGKLHALRLGKQTIGRDRTAEVRIKRGDVSRLHASVEVTPEAIVIADLGSKNGIFRDGVPLAGPTALRDGDVVVVGGIALQVGHAGAQVEAALRAGGEATVSRGTAVGRAQQESLAGPVVATAFFAALVAVLLLWH